MKDFDEKVIQYCLKMAKNGLGTTYPNPLVGCAIVHKKKIIATGWHKKAGEPHAEVNAIQKVINPEILKESTLYVTLEPCSHFGKTPPCSDLIIRMGIPKVIIGSVDINSKVNGKGIQRMKEAGIDVEVGILEKECLELNKRFFTFHKKKRPYTILKWAQTANGFMAPENEEQKWITDIYSKQLVHLWRTEEEAILVGTGTAKSDNPRLSARLMTGNQPVRIALDRNLILEPNSHLLDDSQKTLIFTEKNRENTENTEYLKINFFKNTPQQILKELWQKRIQSLIVEGGIMTLNSFLKEGLYDEIRILTSQNSWAKGRRSPDFTAKLIKSYKLASDRLDIYKK